MISEERIKELAHRRATKYTHRSAPQDSSYGFTDSHLADLCRDIHQAIEAEAQRVPDGYVFVPVERKLNYTCANAIRAMKVS